MRPSRLEMAGFASFCQPTDIDFEGADLFVLSGPTGAGKSSVIDAIVFALYGSVPRYDDRRLVAPVISQGHREARVRLTFTIDDRRFAATRVVRRTRTGATTKEARLERLRADTEPEVLAGTADELTGAVESLLGLTFDHFIRTVVLPQGDFQEFLHARPKDRQDLLIELLDLNVYRRIAATARERAGAAEAAAAVVSDRLAGELAGATPEAVAGAGHRVEVLAAVEATLDDARPRLDAMVERGREARRQADAAQQRAELLRDLVVPDGVDDLAAELRSATEERDGAEAELATTSGARERAENRLAGLPDRSRLEHLGRLLQRSVELQRDRTTAERECVATRDRLKEAQERLDEASAAAREAADRVPAVERRHLAHAVAADLTVGAPCPVCDQPVAGIPDRAAPPELDDVRAARAAAEERRATAERQHRAASEAHTTAASRVEHLATELERQATEQQELADELGVEARPEPVRARSEDVAAAERELRDARAAEKRARTRLGRARERLETLRGRTEAAWKEFDRTRDRLGPLEPPPADRDDVAGAWRQLVAFAEEQRPDLLREAQTARTAIGQAEADYRAEIERLRSAAADAGVEVDGSATQVERAVLRAAAEARADHERLQRDVAAAAEARQELARLQRSGALARELGKHLNARNFEQWLLNRALRRLVIGASAILRDLSSGGYSLAVSDDGAFLVIDHRNADESRPARTLSGGETFLASLALALALAEHVADLAAHGSARLEALFLDEGFGTLDAETLDTVAAAIEELGARGRMVGLVTHVRDLAERLPLRYEVRRTPATSTVERVVA